MLNQEGQLATLLVALALSFTALAWEFWALYQWGRPATFSRVAVDVFRFCPVIAVLLLLWLGILIGHLMPAE